MKSTGRKALQPINIFHITSAEADTQFLKKPNKAHHNELLFSKEKQFSQSIDASSLSEELSAFKKKLERLREDREMTEKFLVERDGVMDLHMNHLLQRGEMQKILEIQVDRLFRLKELHAYSSKISPIRSLRAKEQEKRKRFSFEPVAASDAEEPEEETSVKKAEIANTDTGNDEWKLKLSIQNRSEA